MKINTLIIYLHLGLFFPYFSKAQTQTITVTYSGGEFLGYCLWHFTDLQGNDYTFYNKNLGGYSDEFCKMNSIYTKDTFIISYKLSDVEIYNEDIGGNQIIQRELITDMKFANPKRNEQTNNEEMSVCQHRIDSLVTEIKKYNDGQEVDYNKNPSSPSQCETIAKSLNDRLIKAIKSKERIEEIKTEQKSLVAKGCNSCITTIVNKFLQACIDVNGATIKSTLSKCCYDANSDCAHIGSFRPVKYSKLVEKPDVNAVKWYSDRKDKFFVYYYSESTAIVLIKDSKKGIVVVKESGTWKVLGPHEERNLEIGSYVSSQK